MSGRGAKWADVPQGAIAASVADMDLPTPAVVVDAMVATARRGGGYPSPADLSLPLEAAARWWRRHGLVIAPERALPIGSVTAALAFALVRTTRPGDGIVRVRPTYPPLIDLIASTQRRDRPVDLVRTGDGWRVRCGCVRR